MSSGGGKGRVGNARGLETLKGGENVVDLIDGQQENNLMSWVGVDGDDQCVITDSRESVALARG